MIVLIAAGVGVLGVVNVSGITAESGDLFENYGNSQGYLGVLLGEFQKQSMYLKDISIDNNFVQAGRTQTSIQESDDIMMDYLGRYGATCPEGDEQTAYQALAAKVETFRQVRDQVIQLGIDGSFQKSYMLLKSTEYESAQTGAADAISAEMTSKAGQSG